MTASDPRCTRVDAFTLREFTLSLRGLAECDAALFRREPRQHALYFVALRNTLNAWRGQSVSPWRFVYTREMETCGKSQCWNTWAELVELAVPWGTIRADCKALAAAHAAAELVRDPEREWYVGIRGGCHVGHAVAGVLEDGEIAVKDVCIAAGMPAMNGYDGITWERVRPR